jgi:uncharacterized membrane-anchored protein YhcB (DUF1043 family)
MGSFSIWHFLILAVLLGIFATGFVVIRLIVRALRKPPASKS